MTSFAEEDLDNFLQNQVWKDFTLTYRTGRYTKYNIDHI